MSDELDTYLVERGERIRIIRARTVTPDERKKGPKQTEWFRQ